MKKKFDFDATWLLDTCKLKAKGRALKKILVPIGLGLAVLGLFLGIWVSLRPHHEPKTANTIAAAPNHPTPTQYIGVLKPLERNRVGIQPASPSKVSKEVPTETPPNNPDDLIQTSRTQAQEILASEGPDAMLKFYQTLVTDQPENTTIAADYGLALIDLGKLDEAKSQITAAYDKNPKDAESTFAMGALATADGDLAKAEELFRDNIQNHPDHIDSKYNLANIYTFEKKSHLMDAEKFYGDVLQAVPDSLDAKNGLASVYLETNRTDQAIKLWEELEAQAPQEATIISNLKEAYLQAGRNEDAARLDSKTPFLSAPGGTKNGD